MNVSTSLAVRWAEPRPSPQPVEATTTPTPRAPGCHLLCQRALHSEQSVDTPQRLSVDACHSLVFMTPNQQEVSNTLLAGAY